MVYPSLRCFDKILIAERELSTRELYPLAISQLDTAGEFARMKDTMLEMGYTNRLILRIQVVNQTPMFLVTVHPSFQKLKNVLATLKIHNSQNRNNKIVNFFCQKSLSDVLSTGKHDDQVLYHKILYKNSKHIYIIYDHKFNLSNSK